MGKGAVLSLKITGDPSGAHKALSDVESHGSKFGGIMGKVGLGVAGGLGLAAVGFTKLYEAADESRKIGALTEQVIKSTGGAAKVTADQVGNLAGAIAKKTGIDDEAIQSGANLLLTFTNIKNGVGAGNDIFNQTTQIMTDMSAALGTDASGSAIQLGKALNDPVKGITALTRVGVSFTDAQKKQIDALVKSGDVMGAQKVILKELGHEFGGAAEAASTPMDRLQQRTGDLAEKLGGFLLPVVDKASAFLGDKLMPAVGKLADKLGPVLGPIIKQAGDFVTGSLLPAVTGLFNFLAPKLVPIFHEMAHVVSAIIIPAFKGVAGYVTSYVIPTFKSVLGPVIDGVTKVFHKVADAVEKNKGKFVEIYEKVKPFLNFMRDQVAPFIGGVLSGAFDLLGAAIGPVIDTLTWILDKSADVIGFIGSVGGYLFGSSSKPANKGTVGAAHLVGASQLAGGPLRAAAMGALVGGGSGPSTAGQGPGTVINITVNGALDPAAVARQIGALLDGRQRRVGQLVTATAGGMKL